MIHGFVNPPRKTGNHRKFPCADGSSARQLDKLVLFGFREVALARARYRGHDVAMTPDPSVNGSVSPRGDLAACRPHRTTSALPLAIANITLNPQSNIPLYEQIARAIRSAIDAGDLPAGAALPTARELAATLGLGKNTVGAAYSRLVAENYLVSNRRRGTEVSKLRFASIPDDKISHRLRAPSACVNDDLPISYGAQRVLKLGRTLGTDARPFAPGMPDPSIYPRNQMGRLLLAEFCRPPGTARGSGRARFQTAISAYLRHMRGVQCEPHQVIPITSLFSALDLTARVLLDPGHCVLVEEPSGFGIWEIFKAAHAQVFPLPVDRAGADPARSNSPPPRLIYVSPSVGFPFGSQMPEERRFALLELARRSGAFIFESDTDWELSWASKVRAIQGFDSNSRVIYFGSLHETLGPHLRVAYLVVPTPLAAAFAEIANRIGSGPDDFVLSALSTFIAENEYAVHVRTVQSVYARRMAIAIDACRAHIKRAKPVEPSGGFHCALVFSDDLDEQIVARSAGRLGLTIAPLSLFYRQEARERGVVLGLGLVPDRNVDASIRRLSEVIDQTCTTDAIYELAS